MLALQTVWPVSVLYFFLSDDHSCGSPPLPFPLHTTSYRTPSSGFFFFTLLRRRTALFFLLFRPLSLSIFLFPDSESSSPPRFLVSPSFSANSSRIFLSDVLIPLHLSVCTPSCLLWFSNLRKVVISDPLVTKFMSFTPSPIWHRLLHFPP